MKRQIVVTIDCEEKYCGKCECFGNFSNCCYPFDAVLRIGREGYLRCPACKRAEVKK